MPALEAIPLIQSFCFAAPTDAVLAPGGIHDDEEHHFLAMLTMSAVDVCLLASLSFTLSGVNSSLLSNDVFICPFSFFNHLTHLGSDGARAGDDLYLRFFQQLKEMNVTNNTIIIFFSDHGPRVGKIR